MPTETVDGDRAVGDFDAEKRAGLGFFDQRNCSAMGEHEFAGNGEA